MAPSGFVWFDAPSTATPVTAANLNAFGAAIDAAEANAVQAAEDAAASAASVVGATDSTVAALVTSGTLTNAAVAALAGNLGSATGSLDQSKVTNLVTDLGAKADKSTYLTYSIYLPPGTNPPSDFPDGGQIWDLV